MITIRDSRILDILIVGFDLPQEEKDQIAAFGGDMQWDHQRIAALCWQLPGPKWTFITPDNRPIVTGGLTRLHKGVYRSWFMASPEAWTRDHAAGVTACTKEVVEGMLKSDHVHRIETLVLASREKARAWYNNVGLQYESTLSSYGVNGEDAALYVALKKPRVN